MANVAFNIAKGMSAYYATLPAATDSLIMVPIETTGIVSDATMIDYDDLAALLAGASNEQTTMGRKTLTTVTVTTNDTSDLKVVDCDDVTWTAATSNAISAVVVCYSPASGSADSAIIPLWKYDYVETPTGSDITAQINASGLFTAA